MPTVTISQFRKDLFRLVDSAASGEVVEFLHKGMRFRLTRPDSPPVDKLDRVAPLATSVIVGDPSEFADAHEKMTQEVVDNWEAKWNK